MTANEDNDASQLQHVMSQEDIDLKETEYHVEEVAVARLTDEDLYTLSAESLRLSSKTGFRIFLIMLVQGFNQAGYGVDWGVVSSVNAIDQWHTYFGFGTAGATYGTINALMTVGIVVGAPFLALGDVIGRRGINFTGNAFVLLGALLQAFSKNTSMFMGARFILGFGTGMMSSSQYMAEVAPAHLRGRLVGIFGACFQVGSLATSGIMIGLSTLKTNWSWRSAFIIQAVFPCLVCFLIFLITPESPRYLILRGKEEKARRVVAKYQTTEGDNLNHPLVNAVITQIKDSLVHETSSHRAYWDYSVFFTKKVRYRLMVLAIYSIFQQWNGGGIITYYLTPALETIGITNSTKQLGVNLGLTATYFVFTFIGSFIIDIVHRRTLIFAGLISFVILQTAATITSWRYSLTASSSAAALTLVWIFSYQICSSLLIATMHNLYPVEILSLVLRAKGVGLYGFIQGAAGTVQTYGIAIGIEKLGYKIWCVYIVYNFCQLVVAYFVFPETFKLSLEEIDAVFETPGTNPVRMSLNIQKARREKVRLEREIGGESGGGGAAAASSGVIS